MIFKISLLLIFSSFAYSAELPTLYEHYTSGGIKSGLKAIGNHFTLNEKIELKKQFLITSQITLKC